MTVNDFIKEGNQPKYTTPIYLLVVLGSVFLFIFSILLLSSSISSFGRDFADYIITAFSNPFIGLFIGLLATALLQSSSTTTTIAVAAVASGSLDLGLAIPVIMGANVGTTITSTLVSMGYITQKLEFRKAIAAGTIHDFFNIIMVFILFPLEMNYHILENSSYAIAEFLNVGEEAKGVTYFGFTTVFKSLNMWLIDTTSPWITLLIALVALFGCIKFISHVLLEAVIGKRKAQLETTVFSNTFRSFGWGLLITSAVQSSSLTTSLIVPLVATGKVKIERAFQFILGANIGTTLTALIAATFNSSAAVNLAIVHLLFNLIGVSIFLLIPYFIKIPLLLAKGLASYTQRYRMVGFAYILLAFFILPFTLIYFSTDIQKPKSGVDVITER